MPITLHELKLAFGVYLSRHKSVNRYSDVYENIECVHFDKSCKVC
jgi:hypothetical protein